MSISLKMARPQKDHRDSCDMIHFDPSAPNIDLASMLEIDLSKFYDEAHELLPEAPDDVIIYLDNQYVFPLNGTGGHAKTPDTIVISFDPLFVDKEAQLTTLRGKMFHQAFHIVQGHVRQGTTARYAVALDMAIYEGAATAFERDFARTHPSWGDYSRIDPVTLEAWRATLQGMSIYDLAANTDAWKDWSSYNSADQATWRSHRVGTKLVDDYLAKFGGDVRDIRRVPAPDIRKALLLAD